MIFTFIGQVAKAFAFARHCPWFDSPWPPAALQFCNSLVEVFSFRTPASWSYSVGGGAMSRSGMVSNEEAFFRFCINIHAMNLQVNK
jgi:hypothetical protein